MDSTNPPECKFLATYLHTCAGANHVSPNNEDAIEHIACLGLIAWADFPGNKYLLTFFQFRATQIPASLLDHHPGARRRYWTTTRKIIITLASPRTIRLLPYPLHLIRNLMRLH